MKLLSEPRASMPHSESLKRCGCVIYKFANSEMRICKHGTKKTIRWQKDTRDTRTASDNPVRVC
ncbi:hypothetical protein CEV32_0683 [Brucella rhizosphaerae]|uniref:Uncharacterized protein n=1 Tax=Brucella rhizosphaerae TaxID=571254 RepID=A0A256FJ09_9HYPH|nr:hypothetical protein CEV32_0683 [Brucella rhizosphaerae]